MREPHVHSISSPACDNLKILEPDHQTGNKSYRSGFEAISPLTLLARKSFQSLSIISHCNT